jgi:transcriptional regulator with XRE-family HTH domain
MRWVPKKTPVRQNGWCRLWTEELQMVIGERLKLLREQQEMSQGDIEKRTDRLRCYFSRLENGHTVPAIDTLEKIAQALKVPMYRLFTDDAAVHKPNIPSQKNPSRAVNNEYARYVRALTKLFSRMSEKNRVLLLHMA